MSSANYTTTTTTTTPDQEVRPWTEYSNSQLQTLHTLYYITPPLSLLGSLVIAYVVVKGKLFLLVHTNTNTNHHDHNTFKPTFVRLLLGYSIVDILHSLGYLVFGPWALPEGTPWVVVQQQQQQQHAHGSVQTCNAKAFFLHLLQGLWLYSTSLALYHVLKVRFECRDTFLRRRIEPFLHAVAWLTPLVSGAVLIPLGMMNPVASMPGYCWLSEFPTGCDRTDEYDCQRGEHWFFVPGIALSVALSGLCLVTICVSFILIYCRVRHMEARMAGFGLLYRSSTAATDMELTRKTGRQAMYYIGAFFLCNLPTYVIWAGPSSETAENPNAAHYYFVVNSINLVLFPLQGFLKACIFLNNHRYSLFRDPQGPLYTNIAMISLARFSQQRRSGFDHSASLSSSSSSPPPSSSPPSTSIGLPNNKSSEVQQLPNSQVAHLRQMTNAKDEEQKRMDEQYQ